LETPGSAALDVDAARALWEQSEQLAGQSFAVA